MGNTRIIADPVLKQELMVSYRRIVSKCAPYRPACSDKLLRAEVARALLNSVRLGNLDVEAIELDTFWAAASRKD